MSDQNILENYGWNLIRDLGNERKDQQIQRIKEHNN